MRKPIFFCPPAILTIATLIACNDSTSDGGGAGGKAPQSTTSSVQASSSVRASSSTGAEVASSTGTTSGCANPLDCGCNVATCSADEACSECLYAMGRGHQCNTVDPPGAGEFACEWAACATGTQLCVNVRPRLDGCDTQRCEAIPAACSANPTCACVEAMGMPGWISCTQDAAGNITVVNDQL